MNPTLRDDKPFDSHFVTIGFPHLSPSVKTLEKKLNVNTGTAESIRGLIRACWTYDEIDLSLKLIDEIIGGCGIEPIRSEYADFDDYYGDTIALYVNMGDTYDTTIVYDTINGKWFCCSWGDFYEQTPEYRNNVQ